MSMCQVLFKILY